MMVSNGGSHRQLKIGTTRGATVSALQKFQRSVRPGIRTEDVSIDDYGATVLRRTNRDNMLPPRAQSRLEAFTPCERNRLMASFLPAVSSRPDNTNPDRAPRDAFFAPPPWRRALAARGAGVGYGQQKSANLGHQLPSAVCSGTQCTPQ
jgi:hypothetical protein